MRVTAKTKGQWYTWQKIGGAWMCYRSDNNGRRVDEIVGNGSCRDAAWLDLQKQIGAANGNGS